MNVDIQLDELQLEEAVITRDNIEAIRKSLVQIEQLLRELDERVTALE